ncbi:MAG: hypothetical protein ACRDV2_08065, partial [Actinomycetes bacterium]
ASRAFDVPLPLRPISTASGASGSATACLLAAGTGPVASVNVLATHGVTYTGVRARLAKAS